MFKSTQALPASPYLNDMTSMSSPTTMTSYATGRQESAEWILANDGLIAIRSRRDHGDGHADQGLQAVEIAARVCGQILEAPVSDRPLLPPRQVFVHCLGIAEILGQQRRRRGQAAVDPVADADTNRIQLIEHIELGDAEQGAAAVNDGTPQGDRVEPAAASAPAGHRTEFVTHPRQILAVLVEKLRRKRSRTDAGGIGLDDAEHLVKPARTQTGAGGRSAGGGGR